METLDYDEMYKTLIPKIRKYLSEKEGLPSSKNYLDKDINLEQILKNINNNFSFNYLFMDILKPLWDEKFKELYPELGIYI